MRHKLLLAMIAFMAMFGAWSIGGDIVDCWRDQCSPWFLIRLLVSAVMAAGVAYAMRKEKSGE